MARSVPSRATRALKLAAPAFLAVAVLAVLALALIGGHRDARRDLEKRFADRAASTSALVDALLESRATTSAHDFAATFKGDTDAALEEWVVASDAVYGLVAGTDGRVLAATRRAPAAAAARAGQAVDRLGFPGAPPYLLWSASDEGGRALVEIAIPYRSGERKLVHLHAVPARIWAAFFDGTLARALRPEGARALVLDGSDRLLGDSDGSRHPGAPYGRSAIEITGGAKPFTADARIGDSPLRVVYVTSRERLYEPIGGRRGWSAWLAFALAAAAMGGGLWLMRRLRGSHAALRRSEERYALAMRAANDGLWDWDLETGRVHFSDRWQEMLREESSPGADIQAWLERVHPDDREGFEAAIAAHSAGETPFLEHEHRLRASDGTWMWALARGLAVVGPDGRAMRMAGSLSDITTRRRALAHLEHQATHDPLTGLANRAHFFSVLERALERGRRGESRPCAVVFLDLDGFKLVNDRHGHVFGDAVLAAVAGRLQHSVRPGDVVGRLGGDEMAVLLGSCADLEEAHAVADRLREAMREPYEVLGEAVTVSASGGVAIATPDDSAEDVLREADAAMYRAKMAV